MATYGAITVRFSPSVTPAILATGNRNYLGSYLPVCIGTGPTMECALPSGTTLHPIERSAYGIGVTPLAFDADYALTRHFGVRFGMAGGGSYFDKTIPDPQANRFNFTADGNIGLRLDAFSGAVTGGFRLYHISNGYIGQVNPAMDSRLLYLGFER